jgi:uncharacterized membrane protein
MSAIAAGGLVAITRIDEAPAVAVDYPVDFARAQEIIVKRCLPCHSAKPTDDVYKVAPNDIVFDTPAHIQLLAPRIRERAVLTRTMPNLNKTKMTELERAELGKWIADGAKLE